MDIDRFLSVHQSHSLMKVGAINKQMLIAQYAQCEQITMLQKEIAASNSISRLILENQLKEIKYKEQLRYYKSLAYAMREAVEYINVEKDVLFKCFLYELYSELIIENTREAKNNLEDISDKEYCNGIEKILQEIRDTYILSKDRYDKSDFSRLLASQSSYIEQQKELVQKRRFFVIQKLEMEKELLEIKPQPLKNANRGCGIELLFVLSVLGLLLILLSVFTDISVLPSLFLLFFLPFFIPLLKLIKKDKRWKENYSQYIDDIEQKKKRVLENLDVLKAGMEKEENLLQASLYSQMKENISLAYPHWEDAMAIIDSRIPKIEVLESKKIRLRGDLYLVAQCIVRSQEVNVSIIQRRLSCGMRKAEDYLNTLSEIGIIQDNKVQIHSEEVLDGYWKYLKESLV